MFMVTVGLDKRLVLYVTINISYNTSYNTNLHFADDIVEDESLVKTDCHHKHVL